MNKLDMLGNNFSRRYANINYSVQKCKKKMAIKLSVAKAGKAKKKRKEVERKVREMREM